MLKQKGAIAADRIRRITGFSIGPFGGLQWAEPGLTDKEKVRRFLIFLEDRRVLYNPDALEVRSQVEESVKQIRETCVGTLQELGEGDFAVVPIRAIQQACRRFQDESHMVFRLLMTCPHMNDPNAGFFTALGAMRATIGYQVALLAGHYDLEVSEQLARILPFDIDQ